MQGQEASSDVTVDTSRDGAVSSSRVVDGFFSTGVQIPPVHGGPQSPTGLRSYWDGEGLFELSLGSPGGGLAVEQWMRREDFVAVIEDMQATLARADEALA